ncbi:InlB B-repeat-containing protein [Bacteroides sp. AN502(2024)]|uniref:InlB B-repeat-containing protein n=1 Tax=Bacteroides sp. AN502(2024) TaxID=3160599 RepID=UPI0035123790
MKLYPDYIKRWSLGAVAAALFTCIGCTDDMGMNGNGYVTFPSDCLAFTTYLASENTSSATRSSVSNLEIVEEQWALQTTREESGATRGTLTNHLSGSAGVLGFQYGNDENDKTPIAGDDNNLECEFDGNKLVSKDATILWKTITQPHLNVYAYAPYVSTNTTPDPAKPDSIKLDFATAPPTIDYIVPELIARQKDILVARWISQALADPNYKYKTIPLTFNHALTAIRFRVGFKCKVKSVEIRNVYNSGTYNFLDDKWMVNEGSEASYKSSYKISFGDEGKLFDSNDILTLKKDQVEYMILMPQNLPGGAEIVLTCEDKEYRTVVPVSDEEREEEKKWRWEPGKLITYTFYKGQAPETIYFDLALSDVTIKGGGKYSGKVYKDGGLKDVTGDHKDGNHYYVYQSTEKNREGIWTGDVCTPPEYEEVKYTDGRSWSDFITNNTNVDLVIKSWDKDNNALVTAVGREYTSHRIEITGKVTCDLTIDNIYSIYQENRDNHVGEMTPDYRNKAGISFIPGSGVTNAKVTINSVGDNRVGAVHYNNQSNNGNEIIFEGTGSLTVADVDGFMGGDGNSGLENGEKGYWSNHWSSAIGNHDSPPGDDASYGIVINSGIIFAGTTKAENCTAIGGGGNAYGGVTINGGTVTAVATTTGTAIGGGIGFGSAGGVGEVTITGGNVYAYNHANKWDIPSSAIGGAGSKSNYGEKGIVTISGGYVYAKSALGTAIGGGSSYSRYGGDAHITISGGEVFAKTDSKLSASIGGGTGCSNPKEATNPYNHNGGNANITIDGNPIIRTGSIGGGGTGAGDAYIGNATIHIRGGDIQGQFLLSAGTGAGEKPSFTMSGGTIRNSDTADEEYLHVKDDGGAVYLENGTVTINGGAIRNCKAKRGGAIYIIGSLDGTSNASFTMSGGEIKDNEAYRNTGISDKDFVGSGGAIHIIDGDVELKGGIIADNLAAGGNGGGVFIRRGSLRVGESGSAGPVIKDNASEIRETDEDGIYGGGNGGGIYVYSKVADVDVNLKSGKIIGNTADRRGGGLCVIQDNSDKDNKKAVIIIGTEESNDSILQISKNHTLLQGGGVYAKGTNADITINSGTIKGNTVSQYVHNQDVTNEEGSVTLNHGDVKHNVVTFNANDGSENPETSFQNIVTETNSKLVTPEFKRMGYNLVGWNTKPSGAGRSYKNEEIMNIHEDITLYAQWERW